MALAKKDFPVFLPEDDSRASDLKMILYFNSCHESYSRLDSRKLFTDYVNINNLSEQKYNNKSIVKKLSLKSLPDTIGYICLLLSNNITIPDKYKQLVDLKIKECSIEYKELLNSSLYKSTKPKTVPHSLVLEIDSIIDQSFLGCLDKNFIFTNEWILEHNIDKKQKKSLLYLYEQRLSYLLDNNILSGLSDIQVLNHKKLIQSLIDICRI